MKVQIIKEEDFTLFVVEARHLLMNKSSIVEPFDSGPKSILIITDGSSEVASILSNKNYLQKLKDGRRMTSSSDAISRISRGIKKGIEDDVKNITDIITGLLDDTYVVNVSKTDSESGLRGISIPESQITVDEVAYVSSPQFKAVDMDND